MPLRPLPDAEDQLRDIRSITDAALSHLSADDLLATLLSRVRKILDADTAAVLLLDNSGRQLIATAASGLEEEVNQGVRIPVGRGFAGRIAAERRPVIVDRVDHSNVLNPILLDKGIRSLAGVPLLAQGTVVGVLRVGTVHDRVFTTDEAALLQLAADRAALAVQSLKSREDHAAAVAMQRSLVPSALPGVRGAVIAARYVPGSGHVGGDWYDVFVLPSGELGMVVGDVAGSGLGAAVIMGRGTPARCARTRWSSPARPMPCASWTTRCSTSRRAMSWPPCLTPCSTQTPDSCVSHRRAISRRLSRPPASAVPWPRSPSIRQSASPMPQSGRSPRWLSRPVPWCACSPTGWWNAGTSR